MPERSHIPLGSDVELAEWIAAGGSGEGGATSLTDLTDVTGEPGPGKGPVGDPGGEFPLTEVVTREDLDAILAQVAEVEWNTVGDGDGPPFLSGFDNVPGWAPCRFRLNLNSTVFVEGCVARSEPLVDGEPVPIFQLPPEGAPGGDLMFIIASGVDASGGGPTISTVRVTADGLVAWNGYVTVGQGAEGHLSLCGISFSMGQAFVAPPPTGPA